MQGLMMPVALTTTSILRHAARFHGTTEIVSRAGEGGIHRYRYADWAERCARLAQALRRLGVSDGDRIATLAWNGYRHLEIYYAVPGIGAVCHTLNPRLFPDQLAYIANHAEDGVLFFDLAFAALVAKLAPELNTVHTYVAMTDRAHMPDVALPNLLCYEELVAAEAGGLDWPELDENQACGLCYTSGTTGHPKGVLYSHRAMVLHAYGVSGGDWVALRSRDSVMPVVPMFHACAWGIPFAGPMNGAKLVFPGGQLDGNSLIELINAEGVTWTAGVPTVWLDLLRCLREGGKTMPSMQRIMVGGSAAPRSMIKEFEEVHGVDFAHGWGMTETSPVGTMSTLKRGMDDWPAEDRYDIKVMQGRPMFGMDLRIVGPDGTVLPHDGTSSGMLQVRGPWVLAEYYKGDSPESFSEDGWFSTGDVGAITPDGYLRITDRTKDVIKSGGEWISSIELENIAVGHPAVFEAAAIAVPDDKWGERPVVVVVRKPGAEVSREEVLALYDGKVAKWCIPDDVVFVDELPHTATGKLSKLRLREQFRDYQAAP